MGEVCTLYVASGAGGYEKVVVACGFDEAIERVNPITPPTSSLQAREASVWTLATGERMMLPPHTIGRVLEGSDE